MSRARSRRKRRLEAQINVVPYIDVMLVLLIIFMVTTPLLKQGVKVDLPTAHANKLDNKNLQPIIVTVDKMGRYFVNLSKSNAPLKAGYLQNLVRSLLKKNPSRDVLVRGDSSVNYGKVVQAMVLLQQGGVGKVGLMTQTKNI
jgi:biopolymer transport protein TolR